MSKHSPELWLGESNNSDWVQIQSSEIEKLRRQRDELLDLVKQARLEWLDQNQTSDDTDVVTPYDHVLYWGIADES